MLPHEAQLGQVFVVDLELVLDLAPDLHDQLWAYLERAAAHVEVIEALLQRSHKVTRVQLDALWAFVGHKGEKGGTLKKRSVAPSGVPERSTWTHGCGSAAP